MPSLRSSSVVLAFASVLVACGMSSSLASFDGSGDKQNDPSGGASDFGNDGGFSGAGPSPGPQDDALVLVHAAGLSAFRVCFDGALDQPPMPDKQAMPEANVVGVEVGTAVRLPPLGAKVTRAFVWEEKVLRYFLAGKDLSCRELTSLSTTDLKPFTVPIQADLSRGVHLLVLTGCGTNPALFDRTKAQCGDDFDTKAAKETGNLKLEDIVLTSTVRQSPGQLPVQVVHASQPIESARVAAGADTKLEVTFGELGGAPKAPIAAAPPFLGAPAPSTPANVAYDPADQPAYSTHGFTVTLGKTTLLTQSLADVARLSSVSDLPSTYYAAASSYVLLLLGDPNATPKGADAGADELERPHLLVVPVVDGDDDERADAGTPTPRTDGGGIGGN